MGAVGPERLDFVGIPQFLTTEVIVQADDSYAETAVEALKGKLVDIDAAERVVF